MASPVSVYVADDHPVFREGLTRAVSEHPDFQLAGEAPDGRVALDEIRALRPHVALIDVTMPELDGVAVLGAIMDEGLPTKVVLLSAYLSAHAVFSGMSRGASGYLTKAADRDTILESLGAAARGEVQMPPEVQSELIGELRRHVASDRPRLTPRESEVLRMVAEGLSTPEIARQLVLGSATVKSHLQTLYDKLGVSDRASAVAVAMRQGILD
ncbi:MAG TPA: response regulator transcription factor [Solirubrobacteraceae bacterium]|nr:response regulator transcription factor [Solirubrobacteraceae bacterium]